MTNEEIQRTMSFIIEQQAHFAANFLKLEESIQRLEGVQTQADTRMNRIETAFVGLFSLFSETAKAQKELTESQKDLAKRVDGLAMAQAQTDERLSALINTVERYISEGRNGKA